MASGAGPLPLATYAPVSRATRARRSVAFLYHCALFKGAVLLIERIYETNSRRSKVQLSTKKVQLFACATAHKGKIGPAGEARRAFLEHV